MAAPGEAAGGSLRAIPTQAQAAAVGLLGSRARSLLGVCRGRPQGPDGHLVRVHMGPTAQVALVAAPQPASALAPLAKVSGSSLRSPVSPSVGLGRGPVGTEMGVRSRTSCLRLLELLHGAPALSNREPRLYPRRRLWPGWVALDGHCIKSGWPGALRSQFECLASGAIGFTEPGRRPVKVSCVFHGVEAAGHCDPRLPQGPTAALPLVRSHPSPWAQLCEIMGVLARGLPLETCLSLQEDG